MSNSFDAMLQDEDVADQSIGGGASAAAASAAASDSSLASTSSPALVALRPTHDNAKRIENMGYRLKQNTAGDVREHLSRSFASLLADPTALAIVVKHLLHYEYLGGGPSASHANLEMGIGWAISAACAAHKRHIYSCTCGSEVTPTHNKRLVLEHIFNHHASAGALDAWQACKASNSKGACDPSKSPNPAKSKRPANDDANETPAKKTKTGTPPQSSKQLQLPPSVAASIDAAGAATARSIFSQLSATPQDFEPALLAFAPPPAQTTTTATTTPAKSVASATSVTSPVSTPGQPGFRRNYARRTPPAAPTPLATSTPVTAATESTLQKTTIPPATAQAPKTPPQQAQQPAATTATLPVPPSSHTAAAVASSSAASPPAPRVESNLPWPLAAGEQLLHGGHVVEYADRIGRAWLTSRRVMVRVTTPTAALSARIVAESSVTRRADLSRPKEFQLSLATLTGHNVSVDGNLARLMMRLTFTTSGAPVNVSVRFASGNALAERTQWKEALVRLTASSTSTAPPTSVAKSTTAAPTTGAAIMTAALAAAPKTTSTLTSTITPGNGNTAAATGAATGNTTAGVTSAPTQAKKTKTVELFDFSSSSSSSGATVSASPSPPADGPAPASCSCNQFTAMEAMIKVMRGLEEKLKEMTKSRDALKVELVDVQETASKNMLGMLDEAQKARLAEERAVDATKRADGAEKVLAEVRAELTKSASALTAETSAHKTTKMNLRVATQTSEGRLQQLHESEAELREEKSKFEQLQPIIMQLGQQLRPITSGIEAFQKAAARHGMPLESLASPATSDSTSSAAMQQQQAAPQSTAASTVPPTAAAAAAVLSTPVNSTVKQHKPAMQTRPMLAPPTLPASTTRSA